MLRIWTTSGVSHCSWKATSGLCLLFKLSYWPQTCFSIYVLSMAAFILQL